MTHKKNPNKYPYLCVAIRLKSCSPACPKRCFILPHGSQVHLVPRCPFSTGPEKCWYHTGVKNLKGFLAPLKGTGEPSPLAFSDPCQGNPLEDGVCRDPLWEQVLDTGSAAPPAVPRRSPPVSTEATSLPAPAERCRDMCCPAVPELGTAARGGRVRCRWCGRGVTAAG